jgi:hypothetical protein
MADASKNTNANPVRQIQPERAVLAMVALPYQPPAILALWRDFTKKTFGPLSGRGSANCRKQAISLKSLLGRQMSVMAIFRQL